MTDAPWISDAEVASFITYFGSHPEPDSHSFAVARQALAAFLAARVPAPQPILRQSDAHWEADDALISEGFNACRDIVWKGRE